MSIFGSPVTVKTKVDSSSGPVTVTTNTALRDLILVLIITSGNSPTPQDVTDTIGNTYTLIPNSFVGDANGTRQRSYYCLNSTGANASNVVSYNINIAATPVVMMVTNIPCTVSGVTIENFASAALGTNGFTSPTTTTASFSTTGTDEFLWLGLEMSNHAADTVVASGGNTILGTTPPIASSQYGGGCAYQVFATTQSSITESLTTSNPGTNMVATIIAAGFKSPPTFSISGNAGVAGATVSYSGTLSGSTTADGAGAYSISGLVNGSYTITPSKTAYLFSPTSSNQTVSGGNITGVNFTATQQPAATPAFVPAAGTIPAAVNVTITCSTPGSSIFYTTDGSTPTIASTPYTVPVPITHTTTLKAIASATGWLNSLVGTALYTFASITDERLMLDFGF